MCICVFAFIHEDRLHKSSDGCNHVSDIVCLCFCQPSVWQVGGWLLGIEEDKGALGVVPYFHMMPANRHLFRRGRRYLACKRAVQDETKCVREVGETKPT